MLQGEAPKEVLPSEMSNTYAVRAIDFRHITRPKVLVSVGDTVKAGTALFHDKLFPEVQYAAPVSGEVVEVRRGEKRKLLEVVILPDKKVVYQTFRSYKESELSTVARDDIVASLASSGVWPQLIERPYGLVADPRSRPKSIFVSALNTGPLSPDYEFLLQGQEKYYLAGLRILKQLTTGRVHVTTSSVRNDFFARSSEVNGVLLHEASGPHPAGNVGVHIHHIEPISKGDIVWTITPCGVVQMGKLFLDGRYDARCRAAITGPSAKKPGYVDAMSGAGIGKLLAGQEVDFEKTRVVSGNVLTGDALTKKGHLGYYAQQLTLLPEGNQPELFGWILPSIQKLSFHRGFGLLSFLQPKKPRVLNTNTHGEPRAFVQTGAFERVLPMDILPMHLIKAILAKDYDEMEALGIYEVVEEDLALCEFIDPSKQDIQLVLQEGIDLLRHG